MLTLAEQLLLLAYDPEEGVLLPGITPRIKDSLLCAMLLDLLVRDQVSLHKGAMTLVDFSETGDRLLDTVVHAMAYQRRRSKDGDEIGPTHAGEQWLVILARKFPDLRERLMERLQQQGALIRGKRPSNRIEAIVRRIGDTLAGKHTRQPDEAANMEWLLSAWTPADNELVRDHLIERLRFEIMNNDEPGRWATALATLALAVGVLDQIFPLIERGRATNRVREAAAQDLAITTVFNVLAARLNEIPQGVYILRSGR